MPRVRVTAGEVPVRVPDSERHGGVLVEPGQSVTVTLDEPDIGRLRESGVTVQPATGKQQKSSGSDPK